MTSQNIIVEKALNFSIEIVKFCEELEAGRKFLLAKQLMRSGTGIGANVFESQHAESRLDFIHKMKIALKEANETLFWLIICERCNNYPFKKYLKDSVEELIRIMSKIILTSKNRL
jgi:four helix bundle protein